MHARVRFLVCICAHARRSHAVCSPLGNERPETKTNQRFEGAREKEQRCGRGGRRKPKKKKSKDRPVARIGFRTVSNDTGQDTTAAVMVSGIFLPLPAFLFFSTVKPRMSLGMKLTRRFTKVTGHTGMKRAPWAERPAPNYTPARISYTSWSCFRRNIPRNISVSLSGILALADDKRVYKRTSPDGKI